MAKILVWDIETTNLAANYGYIICISYLWILDGKVGPVHTISIDQFPQFKNDPTNDKEVVKEFRKVYCNADLTVAHYGSRFDLPMVNTKLLMHGQHILPNTRLRDTWRISRDKLKLNSNRLQTLIAALGLKTQKTPLSGPIWIQAMAGKRSAIKYVIDHCVADVKALSEAYLILCPLVAETEQRGVHSCGDKYLRSNGFRVLNTKTYKRLFCTKCGAWLKGPVVKLG